VPRADVAVDPDQPSAARRLGAAIRRPAGHLDLGEMPFRPLEHHRPYAVNRSGRVLAGAGAGAPRGGQGAGSAQRQVPELGHGSLLRIRSTTARRTGRRRAPGKVRSIASARRFVYVTTGSGAWPRAYGAPLRSR